MSFEFSAGAIIYRIEEGRPVFLLLVKDGGEYDIAKGHIEKGETAKMAAEREIMEEAGIRVLFKEGFAKDIRYFFYRKKNRVFKKVKVFLAEADSKNVKISDEHVGYEWADYESVSQKIKFKDMKRVFALAAGYIEKIGLMDDLNRKYGKLPSENGNWGLSSRLVPGEGPLDAKIMLVGQAPGKNEDEKLRPFIGRSGLLLSEALKKAGIRRERCYVTSVVQFFPPKNRMPTEEEVGLCAPFLMQQIEIVNPRWIIALGSLSSSVLAGVEKISEAHGRFVLRGGNKVMPTFHPAAALRFKRIKGLFEEDLSEFAARTGRAENQTGKE